MGGRRRGRVGRGGMVMIYKGNRDVKRVNGNFKKVMLLLGRSVFMFFGNVVGDLNVFDEG